MNRGPRLPCGNWWLTVTLLPTAPLPSSIATACWRPVLASCKWPRLSPFTVPGVKKRQAHATRGCAVVVQSQSRGGFCLLRQDERCPATMPAAFQPLLESYGGTRSLQRPMLGAPPEPSPRWMTVQLSVAFGQPQNPKLPSPRGH